MKKRIILVVGLIALLLAGVLVLAGCGSQCKGDGNCANDETGKLISTCGDVSKCIVTTGPNPGVKCDC